jgi:hypothetical protein
MFRFSPIRVMALILGLAFFLLPSGEAFPDEISEALPSTSPSLAPSPSLPPPSSYPPPRSLVLAIGLDPDSPVAEVVKDVAGDLGRRIGRKVRIEFLGDERVAIAAARTAQADPDGLFMGILSFDTIIIRSLEELAPYDPDDFIPAVLFQSGAPVLISRNNKHARNLSELRDSEDKLFPILTTTLDPLPGPTLLALDAGRALGLKTILRKLPPPEDSPGPGAEPGPGGAVSLPPQNSSPEDSSHQDSSSEALSHQDSSSGALSPQNSSSEALSHLSHSFREDSPHVTKHLAPYLKAFEELQDGEYLAAPYDVLTEFVKRGLDIKVVSYLGSGETTLPFIPEGVSLSELGIQTRVTPLSGFFFPGGTTERLAEGAPSALLEILTGLVSEREQGETGLGETGAGEPGLEEAGLSSPSGSSHSLELFLRPPVLGGAEAQRFYEREIEAREALLESYSLSRVP